LRRSFAETGQKREGGSSGLRGSLLQSSVDHGAIRIIRLVYIVSYKIQYSYMVMHLEIYQTP